MYLADNVFEDDLAEVIGKFNRGTYGCMVLLKEVDDPTRFGVAEVKDGKLVSLEEKPLKPKSNLALTGLYGFNTLFFKLFGTLKPSWRGEYELTDIINEYVEKAEEVLVKMVKGRWFSCDTFDTLLKASNYIYEQNRKRLKRS